MVTTGFIGHRSGRTTTSSVAVKVPLDCYVNGVRNEGFENYRHLEESSHIAAYRIYGTQKDVSEMALSWLSASPAIWVLIVVSV